MRLTCTSKIFLFSTDDSQRAAEITRRLGEMIVDDLQPISTVEDRGFNAFVKTLDPHYKIPRNTCKPFKKKIGGIQIAYASSENHLTTKFCPIELEKICAQ